MGKTNFETFQEKLPLCEDTYKVVFTPFAFFLDLHFYFEYFFEPFLHSTEIDLITKFKISYLLKSKTVNVSVHKMKNVFDKKYEHVKYLNPSFHVFKLNLEIKRQKPKHFVILPKNLRILTWNSAVLYTYRNNSDTKRTVNLSILFSDPQRLSGQNKVTRYLSHQTHCNYLTNNVILEPTISKSGVHDLLQFKGIYFFILKIKAIYMKPSVKVIFRKEYLTHGNCNYSLEVCVSVSHVSQHSKTLTKRSSIKVFLKKTSQARLTDTF